MASPLLLFLTGAIWRSSRWTRIEVGPLVQCMLVSLRRSFISESLGHSSTYVLVHVVNHMGAARALHTRARVNDYQFSRMFATLGDRHGSSAPKRLQKGCFVELLLPLSFLPTQCSEMRRTSVHGDPARRRRRVWAPIHHMYTVSGCLLPPVLRALFSLCSHTHEELYGSCFRFPYTLGFLTTSYSQLILSSCAVRDSSCATITPPPPALSSHSG